MIESTFTVVPSTLLWTRLIADVEANAPWQKLRRSLLLLLQLLLVAILALLAARPFFERPAGLARDVVLVIDTSASMAATDVAPNRLEAAKAAVMEALRELPTGGKVSVIAADRSARIVVNETADMGRVRQALDDIKPTSDSGDLGDALELADKLAKRSGDAQILVATDGALATRPTARVAAPIRVISVGRARKNQAIVALAVRTAASTVTRSVFVSVANLDLERSRRRLEFWGDGRLLEVREVLLDAQARADVVVDDISGDVRTLEVRLVSADPNITTKPDDLAVDDTAWAIIPPDRKRLILLVGPGDPQFPIDGAHAGPRLDEIRQPLLRMKTREKQRDTRALRRTGSGCQGHVHAIGNDRDGLCEPDRADGHVRTLRLREVRSANGRCSRYGIRPWPL